MFSLHWSMISCVLCPLTLTNLIQKVLRNGQNPLIIDHWGNLVFLVQLEGMDFKREQYVESTNELTRY